MFLRFFADKPSLTLLSPNPGRISSDSVRDWKCAVRHDKIIKKENRWGTMKKVRITVKKIARYDDLTAQYENPIAHACGMRLNQTFVCNGWERPEGFCESAWETVSPFVMTLAHGGENFYDGWMRNPRSAMISCNDGFRPVSFLLETMEEEAEGQG